VIGGIIPLLMLNALQESMESRESPAKVERQIQQRPLPSFIQLFPSRQYPAKILFSSHYIATQRIRALIFRHVPLDLSRWNAHVLHQLITNQQMPNANRPIPKRVSVGAKPLSFIPNQIAS